MFAAVPTPRLAADELPPWASLLERFYTRANLPLPAILPLKKEEVPAPYHQLLVHSNDMTPTLEGFYGEPMRIAVLNREREPGMYLREVILTSAHARRPVEYGAIRIWLDRLPEPARLRVLEERRPLGNILQTEQLPHLSWPQAFFQVNADAHMCRVMELHHPATLFGRRNLLLTGDRRLLAEVLEVLAPVHEFNRPSS